VILTHAPWRLSECLRRPENRREVEGELRLSLVEGWTIFVVPVLVARDALPAIFVRAIGSAARLV